MRWQQNSNSLRFERGDKTIVHKGIRGKFRSKWPRRKLIDIYGCSFSHPWVETAPCEKQNHCMFLNHTHCKKTHSHYLIVRWKVSSLRIYKTNYCTSRNQWHLRHTHSHYSMVHWKVSFIRRYKWYLLKYSMVWVWRIPDVQILSRTSNFLSDIKLWSPKSNLNIWCQILTQRMLILMSNINFVKQNLVQSPGVRMFALDWLD